jgi:hypothetical protein
MESHIVLCICVEVAVANRRAHSVELALQVGGVGSQEGGCSAPGNFFQGGAQLVGLLHFLGA